uniref:Translin-associated factor X n=1 Tax=Eptatretus burgeri TaxID=7764 RepID=A0A8C4QXZ8_EPTBU
MSKGFQLELDARYDKYERLVKLSRDVTIESKRAIFLLHRCSTTSGSAEEEVLTESDAKLAAVRLKIRDIAVELQGEDLNQYHRAISPGLQEYVEAVSFQHFLRTHKLIGLEEVNRHLEFSLKGSEPRQKPAAKLPLPLPDYILGVADLTGELMRVCIMSMGSGSADPDTPFRLCQFVRSIYDGFCILGNSGPHELSRKLPVLRQSLFKMEDACYALRVRGSEFPHNILASMVSLHERGNHDECDVA